MKLKVYKSGKTYDPGTVQIRIAECHDGAIEVTAVDHEGNPFAAHHILDIREDGICIHPDFTPDAGFPLTRRGKVKRTKNEPY
jgi:hypothetical protein